jgi:hypothetical protein
MSSPDLKAFVVTASFTDDGAPAYLRQDGGWTRVLAEAATFDEPSSEKWVAEKAKGDQRTVCDPYAFAVAIENGCPKPTTTREWIRSQGATTRLRRPDETSASAS